MHATPRYKNLITYCVPRSGSNLFSYYLNWHLSVLSPNEYVYLAEFFNPTTARRWHAMRDGVVVRFGHNKPDLSDTFRWKVVYKENIITKEPDYTPVYKFDRYIETKHLSEIWNKRKKEDTQKYFLKLFPTHLNHAPSDLLMKLQNDDSFFMVLLRRDFRKVVLSMFIAMQTDVWSYQRGSEYVMPEKNSLHIDMDRIDRNLQTLESFYKSINRLNNKCIIDYSDLKKPEMMIDLMGRIYEDNVLEYLNTESYEKLNEKIYEGNTHVPTPYTMKHIDYIQNGEEVLARLDKFDEMNNYYMDLYGIK